MRTVGAYIRVSSQEQIEGYSLDAQRRAIRQLCKERGWKLVKEYADEGISARYDNISKRPGFFAIMEEAKAGAFDTLVVHKFDRLSRRLIVTLTTMEELRKSGVTFLSITEQMDFTTPIGQVQLALLGAFAQYYSDNLSQETEKGWKERAQQGFYVGPLPFGYKKGNDGIPEIIEDEANTVRQAFETYSQGGATLRDIADWINTQGYRTRNTRKQDQFGLVGPRPFTQDSVRDMMANPFYIGLVRHKGAEYPGQHPPIVSRELFDGCAQLRRSHFRRPRSYSKRFRTYLLGNLIRCAFCGERMWANTTKGEGRYYRDTAQRRGLFCYNPGAWLRVDEIDSQVDVLMRGLSLPPKWQLQVEEIIKESDDRAAIAKEAENLQEKLRRVNEQYRDLSITKAEYTYHRKRLEMEISALPIEPKPTQIIAGEELERLLKVWNAATLEEKSQMLGMMFEAVFVDTKAKQIVAYRVKEQYRSLFRLCEGLKEKAGLFITEKYPQLAGIGDPEGIRTPDLCLDRAVCLAATPPGRCRTS